MATNPLELYSWVADNHLLCLDPYTIKYIYRILGKENRSKDLPFKFSHFTLGYILHNPIVSYTKEANNICIHMF